ncbi:CHRD domain-containing protein [Bernardetia sp. MNP-M8]|uniref:CHRD domain-containing protein n=1 Tax=Bernardetia sp. MNP-M8 TaxID=3127470 RepID=UPI0030D35BB2
MKNYWKTAMWSMALILFTFMAASCGDDDEDEAPALRSKVYTLASADTTGLTNVTGTVTFDEVDASKTTVTIDLVNAPAGGVHPAHIHDGEKTTNGPVAFALTEVVNSKSVSTVTQSYDQLINYDGYVNVHLSADSLDVIIANTNIGSNE